MSFFIGKLLYIFIAKIEEKFCLKMYLEVSILFYALISDIDNKNRAVKRRRSQTSLQANHSSNGSRGSVTDTAMGRIEYTM